VQNVLNSAKGVAPALRERSIWLTVFRKKCSHPAKLGGIRSCSVPFEFGHIFISYAPGVSALAATGALIKGLYEYAKQNRFRRFEKFQEMSARFDDNEAIQTVCTMLLDGSPDLASLSKQTKEVFICFLEEVAMMQNSNYINPHIGAYTFGHYATLAVDSNEFWANLDKDDYYYSVFVRFCNQCKAFRNSRSTEQNWQIKI
jgi:hypothetical protein